MAEILAILQARMTSTRLPGKVMAKINGMPIIYWQIKRILKSQSIDNLVIATSVDNSDDVLSKFLISQNIEVYRGDLKNVFSRYLEISQKYNPKSIVRLTADCPVSMPRVIDSIVGAGMRSKLDYLSNGLIPTFPDGLDVEYVSAKAIHRLGELPLTDFEKEHVTVGIYKRADVFEVKNYENDIDLSAYRWTLDTPEDLVFFQFLFGHFVGEEDQFGLQDVLELRSRYPDKFIEKNRTSPIFPINGSILSK
jgi:spore coat polysaccharide biosynthesis protein SpsF